MRKIVVGSFITLDGVMQAAGGPEEGFKYGGWSAPYYDEALDKIAEKQKQPAKDVPLCRKTFEIFASFFPEHEDIRPDVHGVKKLKNSEGSDFQVLGGGNPLQRLLKHDLSMNYGF